MAKRTIVLIDGGFLRTLCRMAERQYNNAFIERFSLDCRGQDEEIIRVLYYDCAPYTGTQRLPVSGNNRVFTGSDAWLHQLARKDLFAVRRGVLKFRGFKPKRTPVNPAGPPTDDDFEPDFEQKGVDMRIGLDMAAYSTERLVERMILVSNDTDCVPAMKFARKAGIQIVIVELPNCRVAPELLAHADFKRSVLWPA